MPDDAQWPDVYVYSWCASNDGVYDYIFPMMDEIIEAMDAKIVHVGMVKYRYWRGDLSALQGQGQG